MSLADKIIPAVKGKHIRREQRLAVIGGYAGFEAVVGCLHIAVAVVNTDDSCVFNRFHTNSFPAHSAFKNISDNSFSGGYPIIPFCRRISVYSSFSAGKTAFRK